MYIFYIFMHSLINVKMVEVLIIMFAGIGFGYLFRNRHDIIKYAEPMLNYSIYLLLFLIGIAVGLNDMVVSRLDTIGMQAFVITVFAILGSCIASYFCYKLFFKKKEQDER